MDHVSSVKAAVMSRLRKPENHLHPATTGNSDPELLQQFLDRADQAAFAALLNRHGPMVLGVCRRILHNAADADDAFQATFLVLALKGRSIRARTSLADWLFGVAIRTSRKAKAALARRRTLMERLMKFHRPASTQNAAETAELQAILDSEIQKLPKNCREVVVLCWLEGKSKSAAAQNSAGRKEQ